MTNGDADKKKVSEAVFEFVRGTEERYPALRTLKTIMFFGILGLIAYAIQAEKTEFWSSIGVGLLVAGAAILVGALMGFLFGIPRTLQHDQPLVDTGSQDHGAAKEPSARDKYQANTNLEQISDWLTKILVGVGLTQIAQIPPAFKSTADYVATGLGSSSALAMAVVLYFLISGFLYGYLWTRLYLKPALQRADQSVDERFHRLEQQTKIFEEKVRRAAEAGKEIQKQQTGEAVALGLAMNQLDPTPGSKPVDRAKLREAFQKVEWTTKMQILEMARALRRDNWREDVTKPIIERTIAIFKALIESDPTKKFHRFHAQLAYALKDKAQPDWAAAERELTKAIGIRGDWRQSGWLLYEFNRAICNINLDAGFKAKQPSSADVKKKIVNDLRVAIRSSLRQEFPNVPEFTEWMRINNVKTGDLTTS